MKVLINNGGPGGYQDYTRYVVDGTLTVEDSINVPTLLNFVLAPSDNSFQIPKRSAYVKVTSEVYASGAFNSSGQYVGGGYGQGKVLATGFISNAPEVEYLGLTARQTQTAFQQVAYHINVTSDEWLLNCKALPYVPAFVGQTQGSILANLAQTLLPGYFNVTSAVASGDIVPYFQYTPDQTWSDIAKTFGDASRYRVKVVDKKITFLPFGDQQLGVSYDETQPQRTFFPLQLTTNVVTVPPVNDAIVLGAIEPQANWENYFVGDGFTANFPLLHNVFDGSTALLLEDDWTETGFQTNMWFVNDPLNVFKVQGQGLQVNMASLTGALNSEYVLGINGLELGGGLNIQHGEILFTDKCGVGGFVGNGAKAYVFSNSVLPDSPALRAIYTHADGGVVNCFWSRDNPSGPAGGGWESSSGSSSGGYNFTDMDRLINAQLSYGAKSIVLTLAPVNYNGQNRATPNYVFTTGWATAVSSPTGQLFTAASTEYPGNGSIPLGTCAQGVDNTAFPVAFQKPFYTAWNAAVTAALNHLKTASYASKIAYIRVGGSAGGEWIPYGATTALLTQVSPSTLAQLNTVWNTYCQSVESNIVAANSGFVFDQCMNGGPFGIPYYFADSEVTTAKANGFTISDMGLQNFDIQAFTNYGNTDGGSNTSGFPSNNFAYNFSLGGANGYKLQTVAASDPTYVGNPPHGTMGSLVPLLPFALQRGATHLELYYQDWQVAYDPTSPNYATYSAVYQTAIQSARGTFGVGGLGGIIGGLYTGAPLGTYIGSVPAGGWPPGVVYGSPGPGGLENCVAGFAVYGQASGATVTANSPTVGIQAPGLTQITFRVTGGFGGGGDIAALQALPFGTVLTPGGFTTSAFLNGQPMVYAALQTVHGGVLVTCVTPNLGGSPYSGSDTGTLSVLPNTVVVSASGAGGVVIQPVFDGQPQGPQIISQMNHTYLLQTWIGCTKWDRYQAIYRTLTGSGQYGGNFLAASGAITWVVTDFNQGVFANTPAYLQNAVVPQITKYTVQSQAIPAFAVYAPVNAVALNLVIEPNGTIIAQPPEGSLFVRALTGATEVGLQYATTLVNGGINLINQPPTGAFSFALPVLPQNLGPEFHYLMGFGQQNQTAAVQSSGNAQVLAFYTNTIPGVGARIRYQSWASGQAVARIQDLAAIAKEAVTPGDNGLRTAVMSNLQPLPRTSAECQLAGAAAIIDREYPQLQGTYTVETDPRKFEVLFNPGTADYPTTGRFFYINSSVRGVSGGIQNFITNTIRIQVVDLREELLNISIDYGPDLYLEKLLAVFDERTNSTTQNLLTPQETAPPPNPIFLPQVGSAFLTNLDNAQVVNIQNSAVTGNSVTIDLGVIPVTACEVRRIDTGWGQNDANRVGLFTTQQFVLSRVVRDQVWYLRQLNGAQTSQFSKALRVVYPFIPSPPSFISLNSSNLQLGYNGFVSDIYGVEVRVPGLSGGPYQVSVPFNYNLPNTPTDSIGLFTRSVDASVLAPGSVLLEPNALALYGVNSYSTGLTTAAGGTGVTPQTMVSARPNNIIFGGGGGGGGGQQPNPPYVPPPPPVNVVAPAPGFPYPTQFLPGDIVLLVSPNDDSFEGLQVVSQAGSGALFNGNLGFAWYDQEPSPRTIGGSSQLVGDALLYRRGPSCPITGIVAASGTDGSGNAISTITLTSSQSVPFNIGDNVIVGVGYGVYGVLETTVQAGASGWAYGIGSTWTNATGILGSASYASATFPATYAFSIGDIAVDEFNLQLPNVGQLIGHIIITFNYYTSVGPPGQDYGLLVKYTCSSPGFSTQSGYTSIAMSTTPQVGILEIDFTFGGQQPLPAAFFNTPNFAVALQFVGQNTINPNPALAGTLYINNLQVLVYGVNQQLLGFGGSAPYVLSQQINSETTLYGQSVVTALPTANSFSFNKLGSVTAPSVTGAGGVYVADGYAAQLPPGSTDGVLFQKPVFSPADLTFDLTQPYVQAMLQIAQAIAPSGRAPGLSAYFFNLMWDYSQPLVIPNVSVPSISGLTVNPSTQQLQWSVLGGQPTGFRIQMIDPATGITQYMTTIDHAHNPQKLTAYRLTAADYFNNRIIVVTPFDDQGDGQSTTIFSPAAPGGTTGQGTYSIGCTFNGLIPGGTTLARVPLDQDIQFSSNMNGSQGILDVATTNTLTFSITRQPYQLPTASQSQVGVMSFAAGATVASFASTGANFLVGDTLRVIAPSGTDPTAQNIGFVLSATKSLV